MIHTHTSFKSLVCDLALTFERVRQQPAVCLQPAGRLQVWRSRRLAALLRTLDHLTDVSWDCYSAAQPWAHTHPPGHCDGQQDPPAHPVPLEGVIQSW